MAKIVKRRISGIDSFLLGWEDGIKSKVGKQLPCLPPPYPPPHVGEGRRRARDPAPYMGPDPAAYARGVARAEEFRRRISAQKPSFDRRT